MREVNGLRPIVKIKHKNKNKNERSGTCIGLVKTFICPDKKNPNMSLFG